MHETVIAKKIIEDTEHHGKVKSITIKVGELAPVTPEQLKPTLKAMVNWDVKIDKEKSKIKCSCGYEGSAKIIERGHDICLYICPKCTKVPEVLAGKDIKIIKIGVD